MTAAVENLILKVRKEAALKEQENARQKELQVKKEAETQKKLAESAKKAQGQVDKFVADLKKQKQNDANFLQSDESKQNLKNLKETAKLAKEDVSQNDKQIKIAKEQADLQKKNLELQKNVTIQSRGISEAELKEENETRKEIKEQKLVLEKMLVNDTLTADQVKKTSEYQRIQGNIDRKEKRLESRANRQIMFQNLKQALTFKNIASGIERMKEGILELPGNLAGGIGGILKGGAEKAGAGLMMALKAGGLIAAFFGLKAFLDSKLFVQLTEFMKSLAPQFEAIFGGFKKLFQGDIIGGLFSILKGLGGIVLKILDSVATGLFNVIARFFGFEGTDSIWGSLVNAFNTVVNFFKGVIDGAIKFFTTTIPNLLKDIFSFPTSFGDGVMKFIDIVYLPLNLAINFLKDIFKFGDPDKPFRMSEFIFGIVKKVKDFFVGLFDFDASILTSVAEKIMSIGRMMKALGAGGIAAIKAILPGGLSPGEAFKKAFDEYMTRGQMSAFLETEGGARQFRAEDMNEVALTGGNINKVDEVALTQPPIVIQSNQNNSVNSSNTQVNQTAVRSHDSIANDLTSTHA
jgi:hypothetical protein